MPGKYGHEDNNVIAAALSSAGLPALTVAPAYVVCQSQLDGSYLVLNSLQGYLSQTGAETTDDHLLEVVNALNSGGMPAVCYTGDDPDSQYGNIAIAMDNSDPQYGLVYTVSVTVSSDWPTFEDD